MFSERVRVCAKVCLRKSVVWRVPAPFRGSDHHFKYRLALVAEGVCVLRFDNEAGRETTSMSEDREFAY